MSVERSASSGERSGLAGRAVFLSYASQDAEAARRICEAFRAAGVDVWFDQNELVGGDAWDAKIRKQIKECALFLPVISANTQARREGYFRLEWRLAVERMHQMDDDLPFLLPVVIDATRDVDAFVPDRFRAVQWTRLPGGETPPAFGARIVALLVGEPGVQASPPTRSEKTGAGAAFSRRRSSRWWVPALLTVMAIAAAVWFTRRTPRGADQEGTRPALAAAAAISEKSVAILPFENRSPDAANEFFADGVHEDVLTNLSYIRDLTVVPRIVAMRYRATKLRPRDLGAELRVAYLVAGTVRRVGNTVRVTGELIHAQTEQGRWNWQRDYEGTDVMAIQSAMATAIAAELRVVLSPQEQKLIARRPTENVEAYNAYLGARAHRHAQTTALPDQQREALALKAVELDPKFAEAWAELARVRSGFGQFGLSLSDPRLVKTVEAIEAARRLAPDRPEVLLAEGEVYYRIARDYDRATANYQRVLHLQPGNPEVYQQLGVVQRRQGKWREALASTRRSVEIDPKSVAGWLDLRHSYAFGRRFDEALAAMRQIVELEPTAFNLRWLLLDTVRFGRSSDELRAWAASLSPEEARSGSAWEANILLGEYEKNIASDVQAPTTLFELKRAWAFAAKGDLPRARARLSDGLNGLRALAEAQPGRAERWSRLALSEAVLGLNDEARHHAEKAVELLPESRDAVEGAGLNHNLAVVLAWTGNKTASVALLRRLLSVPGTCSDSNHPLTVVTLRRDPRYSPLWGDPGFEALLTDPKNNAPLF